jgi:hypothetical protein
VHMFGGSPSACLRGKRLNQPKILSHLYLERRSISGLGDLKASWASVRKVILCAGRMSGRRV